MKIMKKLLYLFLAVSIIFSACEDDTSAPSVNNNSNNPISGCTNMNAFNYNANVDDGSCNGLPHLISGLQLGEYHLGDTLFYLDSINNIGMVFKEYDPWCDATGPPWFAMNYQIIGTDTSFYSGISNTQLLKNNSEQYSGFFLYDKFIRYQNSHYCVGNPDDGWHIPSLAEVRKIYEYGIMPHWDTIQYPNEIRGWAQSYPDPFGNGIHYSAIYAGGGIASPIYTSSEFNGAGNLPG